jgi:DNA polymerase III subunit gamma/tau
LNVSYLVLARKYRPQTLEDLVGQDHIARTLANAITSGRIAHAFLFTGVRGVGKTTSARLLAKCLNCVGPDGRRTAASPTPCNECAPCKEIAAGHDLDVQEIDGASYNGVDEVRRLQEGVTFRPARDRFKIYIVDEVHMLSTSAWNAFLKTLEEPPPHAKFIFATTEAHKVPVTILSRCQRYDFKLIPAQAIARRLEQVLAQESIQGEPAAVQVLAREAAGSMRDAMSLLDQVIAFSGAKLTSDDVTHVLGVADRSVLHELGAALLAGNAAECLAIVARVSEQGFDIAHVAKDVLGHLRNLVVAKVCAVQARDAASLRELLELADEELKLIGTLAEGAELDDLNRCFQGFSRSFDDIVKSGQPRMALEMTLVRLARRPPLLPLDELLSRVADLERRLGGGPPSASPPRGGSGSVRGGSPGAAGPPQGMNDSGGRTRGALALAPGAPRADLSGERRPVERSIESPRPVLVSVPNRVSAVDPLLWRNLVEALRATSPAHASIFEHALPIEVGPSRVVLTFESGKFVADRASDPEALGAFTEVVRSHFGAPTAVVIDTSAKAEPGVRSVAAVEKERRDGELAKARAAVEEHPLVREASRLFGAQVRDVKLPNTDS